MLDDGSGDVEAAVPVEAKPKPQVDILDVTKEIFVEAPRVADIAGPVERCGGAGSKDLTRGVVDRTVDATVTIAPGQPADVIDVADSVQARPIVRVEHTAAKKAVLRMRAHGGEELLEPVGPREGIGVEEDNPLRGDVAANRKIVSRCKSQILSRADDLNGCRTLRQAVKRPIR